MYIGMTASICSLVYTCIVLIVYFRKIKLKNDENTIYSFMIFSNVGGLMFEFLMYLFALIISTQSSFIPSLIERLYFVYLFTWLYLFAIYIYIISYEHKIKINNFKIVKNKSLIKVLCAIYFIFIILISTLPVKHIINDVGTYSTGPACFVLYISAIISIITSIIFVLKNRKEIKVKNKFPIISLIVCLIAMFVIRVFIPEALFVSTMLSFVTILIYFTLENPDIKMAKDLEYSKKLLEESNDKTFDILDDMSDKLENSINKLHLLGCKKINTKNNEEINKNLRYMQEYCINFAEEVSNLIEVGKIESGNLRLKEKEYETIGMLDEIKKLLICENSYKKVKNLYSHDNKIPYSLYGDKDLIKQMFFCIYDYLEDIIDGNVDVHISSVSAGNLCRLKIYFKSDNLNLNDYFYTRKHLNAFHGDNRKDNIKYIKINKVKELLDAEIEVVNNSNLLISITQRIVDPYIRVEQKEQNAGIKVKYFNASTKKILILGDNNSELKELVLLLRPYKINIDISNTLDNMINKLSSSKTYDLVFMNDVIDSYDSYSEGIYNIRLLKKIAGYKFKSIIILSKSKEKQKEKYLESGFDDYIIKPINKKNINGILVKCLKNK